MQLLFDSLARAFLAILEVFFICLPVIGEKRFYQGPEELKHCYISDVLWVRCQRNTDLIWHKLKENEIQAFIITRVAFWQNQLLSMVIVPFSLAMEASIHRAPTCSNSEERQTIPYLVTTTPLQLNEIQVQYLLVAVKQFWMRRIH